MKFGMKTTSGELVFTPNQVASMRLSIAALVLLPISLRAIRRLKWDDLKWILVVGLVALFRKPAEPRQVVGVLIGLSGAIALVSLKGFGSTSHWEYSILIVLATISYGFSVNTVQSKLKHVKALEITALSLLAAGIPCSVYALNSGVIETIQTNPNALRSLGFVCILAIGGTAMANMMYFWLTLQTSALIASSVTYLMPLVSASWGLYIGEELHFGHVICGIIILSGVWLVTRKKAS